jgi:MinD-like ATPase involved in chromosome partitioning or flagellar assembly
MSAEVNMGAEAIPRWPRIEAVAREDGTGEVTVNGTSHPVTAANLDEVRIAIISVVAETAGKLGRPVRVSTSGPDGYWPLIVHPDGSVTADEDDQPRPGRRAVVENSAPRQPSQPAASPAVVDHEADGDQPSSYQPGGSSFDNGASSPFGPPAGFAAEPADAGQQDAERNDADPDDPPDSDAGQDDASTPYNEPSAGESYTGQPSAGEPHTEEPSAGGSLTEQPSGQTYTGQPHNPQPYAGQPYTPRPYSGQPSSAPPYTGQPYTGQPYTGQPFARTDADYPASAPTPPVHNPRPPATPYVPSQGAANQGWEWKSDPGQPGNRPDPTSSAAGAASAQRSAPTAQGNRQPQRAGAKTGETQVADSTPRRQSFLTQEQVEEPASRGFRGFLGRVGIRMAPNESERSERADMQAVSQHWPGPRTISIVNGKGGAGKTPTTVLLSAVFAMYGGAGVVAWDNNQTRGTLGWRTEQGQHESTLLDLLPQIPRLLGTRAQSADLAHFVHHQTRDRFDVLRSKPMVLAHEQRVEPEDVDAIHAVLGKYYRLIFIDSGNDESDPMWLRMVDHSDQLVVATTTRDDHAEAGALLLEALAERDERSAGLARNSIAIVTQADPSARPGDLKRVAAGYQSLTRATVTIPFDPAMVDGLLRYGSLQPETRRAWLAAAGAVARGL